MPSRGDLRREALFEKGAAALARVFPEHAGLYACPQCGRGFPKKAIDGESARLTIEHVPPGAMDSLLTILTCRECNVGAGGSIEAAMHRRRQFRDFMAMSPGASSRVTVNVAGTEVNADLIWGKEDSVRIEMIEAINDPERYRCVMDTLDQFAESGDTSWEMGIRFSASYDRRMALVGNLRSAFLATFALLGYRFAFHPLLRLVRLQLCEPKEPHLNRFFARSPAVTERPRLALIDTPWPAILWQWRELIMLLPDPSAPDFNLYDAIAKRRSQGLVNESVKGRPITMPSGLEMRLDFRGAK